jgi:hypothetical protein
VKGVFLGIVFTIISTHVWIYFRHGTIDACEAAAYEVMEFFWNDPTHKNLIEIELREKNRGIWEREFIQNLTPHLGNQNLVECYEIALFGIDEKIERMQKTINVNGEFDWTKNQN